MSTDLELRPELLGVVSRPPVKIQIPRPSMADGGAIRKERNESAEECCRTPTSAENKIPEVLQCPPAPRKRKRAPSCRRRLMEIDEFVEILNREEIEPYLTASLELEDRVKSAKRCFCECK